MSAVSTGMVTGARGAGKVLKNVPPNRAAAVMAWLFSAFTTSALIESVRNYAYGIPSVPSDSVLSWFVNLALGGYLMAAVAVQLLLTLAESPIWKGQKGTIVSWTFLIIDTLVNAAAIFPFVRVLDKTPVWYMIVTSFESDATYHPLAALVLTLFLGAVMAGAPEKLWSGT